MLTGNYPFPGPTLAEVCETLNSRPRRHPVPRLAKSSTPTWNERSCGSLIGPRRNGLDRRKNCCNRSATMAIRNWCLPRNPVGLNPASSDAANPGRVARSQNPVQYDLDAGLGNRLLAAARPSGRDFDARGNVAILPSVCPLLGKEEGRPDPISYLVIVASQLGMRTPTRSALKSIRTCLAIVPLGSSAMTQLDSRRR